MANVPSGQRPTSNSNQRPAGTRFRTTSDAGNPLSGGQRPSDRPAPAHRAQGAARTPSSQGTRPAGTRFADQRHAARPSSAPYGSAPVQSRPVKSDAASPYARRTFQKKSSPVPVIIGILIAVAAVVAIALFVFPAIFGTPGAASETVEAGQEVTLTIPDGASGDEIASILSENHVIENPKDYYAAVKKLNADMSLKPGAYVFYTGQDPIEVVKQLVAGPNGDTLKLVIPEGKTVMQTADIVESTYGIPADEFLAQAKASNYVDTYPFLEGVADDSLEGYLFPKTYTFSGDPTADQIIRAMLDQFQIDVLNVVDFDAARASFNERYGLDLSVYELINLASIVEREGLYAEQRAHVASVFLNRLAGKGDFIGREYLQSDATLMYETGGAVTASDIQNIESPYNSYKNAGLPPTPICSPSLEAINATLNPTDSNDLYFYITTDEEFFSETYDEHMQSWN